MDLDVDRLEPRDHPAPPGWPRETFEAVVAVWVAIFTKELHKSESTEGGSA
jgi:hypothetical protein